LENTDEEKNRSGVCSIREAFINILLNYINSRGTMLLSLLKASGMDKLKIELRGLRRYFNGECGYEKFDELYFDLKKNTNILDVMGGFIELYDEYIVVTKELLNNLVNLVKSN